MPDFSSISDYSTDPDSNAGSFDGTSANTTENVTRPNHVNNLIRALMAHVAKYTRRTLTLASAATLNFDSVDSLFVEVSGTTTVTAVTLSEGHLRFARASGAFSITASASVVVNGATSGSTTVAVGDVLLFEGGAAGLVRVYISRQNQFTTIEVGHASDTTLSRASAGDVAVEGNRLFRVGGADVPLADGGTGASLSDPNADRMLFWDDSAGTMQWLEPGTGLSIAGTTITASSLNVYGSGSASGSGAIGPSAIPAGVNRITMILTGISSSGTSVPYIGLLDSGGLETTGYTGSTALITNGASPVVTNHGTGWVLGATWAASWVVSGLFTLTRITGNTWAVTGLLGRSDATAQLTFAGQKTLSAELTGVALVTADTFDAGTWNVFYE